MLIVFVEQTNPFIVLKCFVLLFDEKKKRKKKRVRFLIMFSLILWFVFQ